MKNETETLRGDLESSSFPALIVLGGALLKLTQNSKETGKLDIDRSYGDDDDLQFLPEKSYRFNTIATMLRSYLPDQSWFDASQLKGKKRSEVITMWYLLINAFLSKKLLEVAVLRELQGETRSSNAYRKGSMIIAGLEYPYSVESSGKKLAGIGPKISEKLSLLLLNGDLDELKVVKERNDVIRLFSFWGSNTITASLWYNNGYRTIKDLESADSKGKINLTKMQRMSILHLDDFDTLINVEEANHIVSLVRASVPVGFETILVGSFRRGKPTSKDCDILVIGPKTASTCETIATNLSQIADLEIASQGQHVFMGMIKTPSGIWKRVDVFVASEGERGCSLVAHTGPAKYNIRMRADAQSRGWLLNEKHLINDQGEIIPTETEEQLQEVLNFPIQEPKYRK